MCWDDRLLETIPEIIVSPLLSDIPLLLYFHKLKHKTCKLHSIWQMHWWSSSILESQSQHLALKVLACLCFGIFALHSASKTKVLNSLLPVSEESDTCSQGERTSVLLIRKEKRGGVFRQWESDRSLAALPLIYDLLNESLSACVCVWVLSCCIWFH